MRHLPGSIGSFGIRVMLVANLLTISGLAWTQNPSARQKIDIPRQPASDAIRRLTELTNFQILYSAHLLRGLSANPVQGTMTPRDALSILLRDTEVEVIDTGPGAATLRVAKTDNGIDDNPEGMPSVLVTARKFSERLVDVPIAVSVFTRKTLRRRGASSNADVMQDAPGVSVYDAGSGISKISIRGISTSLGGNENGYYLDDLPFSGVSVPISPDVRAWDLDRIEVLRGPQGTLFGEGSMGGTIRTLTNNAQLNKFAFAGQAGLSHTDGGGSNRSANAMINLPVIADRMALRIAVTDDRSSGWVDEQSGPRNINPARIKTARLRGVFQPIDGLRINATYWHYEGSYLYGLSETDAGFAPQQTLLSNASPAYTLKGISGTYDLDAVSVFYGYAQNRYDLPLSGTLSATPIDFHIGIDVAAHELRVSSNAHTPWRWTAGLYRRVSTRRDFVAVPLFGLDQISLTKSTASSVFGEIACTLPEWPLEVSLGSRHFRDRLEGIDVNSGLARPSDNAAFRSDNPRLSVAYRPLDDWQIYSSASKGFRSGQRQVTGFEQVALSNSVTIPAVIKPDSIWTYELGTKITMLERRLNMELAVYHSDWKDVAVRIPIGSTGLNVLINSEGTKTNGLDATATYMFTRSLTATIGGGLVDARYAGSVAGTGIGRGARVEDVPRLTFSASGEYNFPTVRGWDGMARVGLQHASPHLASTVPANKAGDTINNVNARLSFRKGAWTFSLFGENLSNDRGAASFRTVTPLTAATNETYAPRLRPRTIGLEILFASE